MDMIWLEKMTSRLNYRMLCHLLWKGEGRNIKGVTISPMRRPLCLLFVVMMLTMQMATPFNKRMFRGILRLRSPMTQLGLLKSNFGAGMGANFGRINAIQSPTNGVKVMVKGLATIPDSKADVRIPAAAAAPNDSIEEKKSPGKGGFKWLIKKYGYLSVGTYLSIYIMTLGAIYTSLEFDIFNAATFGLDPTSMITKFCNVVETTTGNTQLPTYIKTHPSAGIFAIAWVMTKFTEPVRLGVTIYAVPKISKFLRKRKLSAAATELKNGKGTKS